MTAPRDARGERPEVTQLTVSEADAGLRLEQWLMRSLGCSRSEARWLCEDGAVRVDGRREPKGARVRAGAEVRVELGAPWLLAEPDLPLDVRLERADLVVVDKPAGMPSVPLRPGERGTLANALLGRYAEMRGFGHSAREPGLIHRLDNQTSGLLVAARTQDAFERLLHGLRAGWLEKRYLAVVPSPGLADSGTIDKPLGPDPGQAGRVRTVEADGSYRHDAKTTYRVIARGAHFALVELAASRAFRHQVRVHLASIGHAIAGDTLYGGVADARLDARHALHANFLAWNGEGLAPFSVSTEPPPVFLELVNHPKS
jgi:23S rRNA pseudouridine1911/1915/1917 synthase